jgi:hypothetical protein
MWIRKSGLALWVFLACAVALLPIACSNDDDDTSNQVQDAASEKAPVSMTGS